MTDMAETEQYNLSQFQRAIAAVALNIKYMLLIPIAGTVYLMGAYVWGFSYSQISLGTKLISHPDEYAFTGEHGSEATIGLLEAVDGILIMSVAVLIVFGTVWINVLPPQLEDHLPSALQGLTSGRLKEKLASSLVTASAVYLFKIVIQLTSTPHESGAKLTWNTASIFITIHGMFILGLAVIAFNNRKDPHTPTSVHKPDALSTH